MAVHPGVLGVLDVLPEGVGRQGDDGDGRQDRVLQLPDGPGGLGDVELLEQEEVGLPVRGYLSGLIVS